MELDRENPAFILLPDSPQTTVDEKEHELTQFEFDQSETGEQSTLKSHEITLSKPNNVFEADSCENLQVAFE